MRFEDLHHCCCNLLSYSNMIVLEKGKEPVESKLQDIYDEIYNREVIWFCVENDNTIIIKFKEE